MVRAGGAGAELACGTLAGAHPFPTASTSTATQERARLAPIAQSLRWMSGRAVRRIPDARARPPSQATLRCGVLRGILQCTCTETAARAVAAQVWALMSGAHCRGGAWRAGRHVRRPLAMDRAEPRRLHAGREQSARQEAASRRPGGARPRLAWRVLARQAARPRACPGAAGGGVVDERSVSSLVRWRALSLALSESAVQSLFRLSLSAPLPILSLSATQCSILASLPIRGVQRLARSKGTSLELERALTRSSRTRPVVSNFVCDFIQLHLGV
eukprot:3779677-Rhodomonas_salina.1